MNWELVVQSLAGIGGVVTVLLVAVINRRNNRRDSMSEAARHLAEGAENVGDAWQKLMEPLVAEIERQRHEIHQLRGEVEDLRTQVARHDDLTASNKELERRVSFNEQRVTELTGVTRSLIRYARRQRAQIIELGGDPEPFPAGLEHLDE
jgi:TolA-binding protein